MIKKSLLTLIMAVVISSAGLTGCGVSGTDTGKILQNNNSEGSQVSEEVNDSQGRKETEKTEGTENSDNAINEEIDWATMAGEVSFPSEYMISYDVALEDGSIITISEAKDAAGNVYYQNGDMEAVFVKSGSSYSFYVRDENGVLSEEKNSKYKAEYVEKFTKEFLECAQQNSIMAAGSAKNEGTITITDRTCNYYSVRVGFANFVQSYEYAFDSETGICLAITDQKAISGYVQEGESGFTCVKFQTSEVIFELPDES